ncbi:myosin heavy chain IB-like [Cinclus cinclus]|uniref:myosin heavy chain IB-like n=1 Tax=Cinclus cinclus TaxID=127875 RepID=UPI002E11D478
MRGPSGSCGCVCGRPGEPGRGRAGSAPAASAEGRPGLPAPNGRVLAERESGASLPKEGWSWRCGPGAVRALPPAARVTQPAV